MPNRRFARSGRTVTSAIRFASLVIAASACDRTPRSAANDTAGVDHPPPDSATESPARNPGWSNADGPVLLVASNGSGEAHVIAPRLVEADGGAATLESARTVTLVARDGRVTRGRIVRVASHDGAQCLAWPTATLADVNGGAPAPWNVGLLSDSVTPLPLDSVEAFSRSDSTRLATAIARLASALKDDTATSFRGLPFVVREMRRFRPATDVEAVVADVARLLATEANPREERLFMIAERDDSNAWRVAFVTRSAGAEDAVETTDALLAARLQGNRIVMIVALESAAATRFAILQRDPRGRWSMQWRSAETDC